MTNKEEMLKRFDEKFEGIYYGKDFDGMPSYPPEGFKADVKVFLKSEIDLAVEEERERIVGEVNKIELKIFDRQINKEVVEFYKDAVEETKRIVLSLITKDNNETL